MHDARPREGETVVRMLGVGLAFVTFVARDARGTLSVCKRLRDATRDSADATAQLAREADVLALLTGRGAPRLVARGEDAFGPWVAMEFLPGTSLAHDADTLHTNVVARAAFAALADIHDADVVHGDVSPSNVMVDGDRAWLVDFCTAQSRDLAPLQAREFIGTLAFTAPERARSEPIDARADLFSLAASIVSIHAGRDARARGHNAGDLPLAAQLAIAGECPLDPAFVALAPPALARCLAFDRDRRPAGARAVLAELW